jgi:hypothetical protein
MSTVFMQLQSTAANAVVPADGVLSFDTNLSQSVNNISYNEATGVIAIPQTGVYYVYWSVVTQLVVHSAEVSVVTSTGDIFYADSSLREGMITGSAIIDVDTVGGVQFSIRNTSSSDIQLADVNPVANLVIHSIETDSVNSEIPVIKNGGSVVNFNSGGIDVTNPLTYPILLDILQISWMSDQINQLSKLCTPEELEICLGLHSGILSNIAVKIVLSPVLLALEQAIDALTLPLQNLFKLTSDNGLISMDSYIGHSNVGIVPAIASADLPILSLVAGPPYPQIIARDGMITSFAAEYDCLAAVDISLINLLPGAIHTVNGLITAVIDAFSVLVSTIGSLSALLLSLGSPLTAKYADILNKRLIHQFKTGTPNTNHHVHAILWKGSPNQGCALGGEVDWEKVSDLDLGLVPWLELAPIDTFLSSLGDVIAAGGNTLSTLLSLLGSRTTPNLSPTNTPFLDAKTSGIKHPIQAGDYLMVQFTLVGSDNTTILAGVLATNLMASVQIEATNNC